MLSTWRCCPRYGQERPTTTGQVLFREGDRAYDFIVVLSGAVGVVDHKAGVERELATLGPGRFVAELNIMTGERVFATAVVREPGLVLVVPVDRRLDLDSSCAQMAQSRACCRLRFHAPHGAHRRVSTRSPPGSPSVTVIERWS
jgi:hypothetical protein